MLYCVRADAVHLLVGAHKKGTGRPNMAAPFLN